MSNTELIHGNLLVTSSAGSVNFCLAQCLDCRRCCPFGLKLQDQNVPLGLRYALLITPRSPLCLFLFLPLVAKVQPRRPTGAEFERNVFCFEVRLRPESFQDGLSHSAEGLLLGWFALLAKVGRVILVNRLPEVAAHSIVNRVHSTPAFPAQVVGEIRVLQLVADGCGGLCIL